MSGSELLSVLVVHWLTRPGGWRRISSRYRDTEAGEWEQVNNHEDSVGDVINWSVSPAPPRPAQGLSPATTADSGKMSAPKVSTRPGWGPGALHTCRVTAAWCIQLLSSNKHFSYPQLRRQSRQLICSLTPGPRDPWVIHNNHPPYTLSLGFFYGFQ